VGAVLAALAVAAGLLTTAGAVSGAQTTRTMLAYSAQFNCGLMPQGGVPLDPTAVQPQFPNELPAKPANYATDVNVHNPQLGTALLVKKAVLTGWVMTGPAGSSGVITSKPEQPFQGGRLLPVRLAPDNAFEIDCTDITTVLAPPGFNPSMSFIKGFVVIYSLTDLDVVASYTSERVGPTTIDCLYQNGSVVTSTTTQNGSGCPPNAVGPAIGIAASSTGTGLTLDTVPVTPKVLNVLPGQVIPGVG
jgi:hypothetical protein